MINPAFRPTDAIFNTDKSNLLNRNKELNWRLTHKVFSTDKHKPTTFCSDFSPLHKEIITLFNIKQKFKKKQEPSLCLN